MEKPHAAQKSAPGSHCSCKPSRSSSQVVAVQRHISVVEQSAELARATAEALKEHRDSIGRKRSICEIPADFLNPYVTTMNEGWELLRGPSAPRTPFSISHGMLAQHYVKKNKPIVGQGVWQMKISGCSKRKSGGARQC